MTPGLPFHYDVWFSYLPEEHFWGQDELPEPIWSNEDYDLNYVISDKNKRQLNLTLGLDEIERIHSENATYWMHYQMATPDVYFSEIDITKPFAE